ncbi:MAG: methyltetrahydrofolate cobalamin methyltransferase [Planctomycetota bacterium]
MIIIGEKINSTRKDIAQAIENKDAAYIQQIACEQTACGADMLDVNCGTKINEELEKITWLIKTIQQKVNVPLVIDSPNHLAIEAGLKAHTGRAVINSVTAEKDKFEIIFPLAKKYNAGVIALLIDEKGMPNNAQERFDIARKLIQSANAYQISPADLYIDPLVRSVAAEPTQGIEFLESLRLIKTLPGIKTICGVSNVSFGLPNRKLLNSTFITMAIWAGLDSAILDPTDKSMMSAIKATEALLNKDEYCMGYITAHRESRLK